MRKREKRSHCGFTLIELVIVITILAILAAVAIPAFQNLTTQARNAATQGALGGLRAALAIYRANEVANNRPATFPTVADMADLDAQNPMQNQDTPDNPWCSQAGPSCTDADAVVGGAITARTISGTAEGWRYDATSGLIYANTSVQGENAF